MIQLTYRPFFVQARSLMSEQHTIWALASAAAEFDNPNSAALSSIPVNEYEKHLPSQRMDTNLP
jgi:hypothetical protein